MGLRVVRTGRPRTFRLEGELDLSTADEAEPALFGARSGGVMTLDLPGLSFMDSTGIHLILRLMRASGGVRLVAPSPMVRKVLSVSGLDRVEGVEMTDARSAG